MACHLSYEPPSYRSAMMAFRLCVQRYGRLPQELVVDHGPEFGSVYFEALLSQCFVTKIERPASQPHFGSVIERLFGTTSEFLMEHPALFQSPRESYEQGMQLAGARARRIIPYNDAFLMQTRPTTRTGMAKIYRGLRVYLDEGESMRQAPEALLTPSPQSLRCKAAGCLRAGKARREQISRDGNYSRFSTLPGPAGTGCLLRARSLPDPAGAGSPAPAGYWGLLSADRSDPGDLVEHRQKTYQQSVREAGSLQSHPGGKPGACPLTALVLFPPNRSLPCLSNLLPFLYF
jgi:hypothetical protein